MERSPLTIPEEVLPVERARRTKRNRRATACSDKRRGYFNCGICGSENLVREGVKYCLTCGEETAYLAEHTFSLDAELACECHKKGWNYRTIEVEHCLDCGATKGTICPACGKRACWSKGSEKFCKRCGFRA